MSTTHIPSSSSELNSSELSAMECSPSVPAIQSLAAGRQPFSATPAGLHGTTSLPPIGSHHAGASNSNYSEFTQTRAPFDHSACYDEPRNDTNTDNKPRNDANTDNNKPRNDANADNDESMEDNDGFMDEDFDTEGVAPLPTQHGSASRSHVHQNTGREEPPIRKRVVVESAASTSLLRTHNTQLRGQLVRKSGNFEVLMRRRTKTYKNMLEEQAKVYDRARQTMLETQARDLEALAEQTREMMAKQDREHDRVRQMINAEHEQRLEVYGRTLQTAYERKMVDMEQAQTREWESRQEQWKAKFEEYEKEMTDKMDKIKEATKEDEIAAASHRAQYQRQRTPSSPTPVATGRRPSRRSSSIGVRLQVLAEDLNENHDQDMQTSPTPQPQRPTTQAPDAGSSQSNSPIPPQRPAQTPDAGPLPSSSTPKPAQATGTRSSPPASPHTPRNPPSSNIQENPSHYDKILEKLSELGNKIEKIEKGQNSTPERQRGANTNGKRYGRSPVTKMEHRSKYLEVIRKWYKEKYNLGDDNDISLVESVKQETIDAYTSGNPDTGPNDAYLPLDLIGNEKSIWNKRVFTLILGQVKILVKDAALPDVEDAYLMEMIEAKFGRLRQKWRDAIPKTDIRGNRETMEEVDSRLANQSQKHQQQARRLRRRVTKYERRVRVVQTTLQIKTDEGGDDAAAWKWLGDVLDRLGQEGTSSDESDDGVIEVLYRVKLIPWRRPMENYLDLIDKMRFSEPIFPPQGSKPQKRIRAGGLQSNRKAVDGLPRCLYDEQWLKQDVTVSVSKEAFEWLTLMNPL